MHLDELLWKSQTIFEILLPKGARSRSIFRSFQEGPEGPRKDLCQVLPSPSKSFHKNWPDPSFAKHIFQSYFYIFQYKKIISSMYFLLARTASIVIAMDLWYLFKGETVKKRSRQELVLRHIFVNNKSANTNSGNFVNNKNPWLKFSQKFCK